MALDSSAAHRACCHLPRDCFGLFCMQGVGQGDPKRLHWYHLRFRAVSGHLGPPPAGIWAGGISISSWRETSEAATTGCNSDGCSEVLGSLSLEYVVCLGKMDVFMA